MTRTSDRSAARVDRPCMPQWGAHARPQHRTPGPLPLRDFLPRLETFTRFIPVRVWRHGHWHVIWVVIRSVELVHVAGRRPRRTNNSLRRRQA